MNLDLLDILTAGTPGTPGQNQGVPPTEIPKPSNNAGFRALNPTGTPGTSQNTNNILNVDLNGLLADACTGLALKPEQLWRFLSPEDIDDIKSGLIDLSTLKGYAIRWNMHPYLVPVGNGLPYPFKGKQP